MCSFHRRFSTRADSLQKKELSALFSKKITEHTISKALQELPSSFFEKKSQERAKRLFSLAMHSILQSKVSFPRPLPIKNPESYSQALDTSLFRLCRTDGVQEDIPHSSRDPHHLHVYQVASQYNAAEASSPFTPPIGEAMQKSAFDFTQGPLAQRTNPVAFELVNAFLTHLGFNMLEHVLPSAGKTYVAGSSIEHGYLTPTKNNLTRLTDEFKQNFCLAEYVCYSSLSREWKGCFSVSLFLQAAPAIGYADLGGISSDEMEKYAALANYSALFCHGITLAQENRKPVILHATAVGAGVFGNQEKNLKWGFEKAALALQKEMKKHQVLVQLEHFSALGGMKEIADLLEIPKGTRK